MTFCRSNIFIKLALLVSEKKSRKSWRFLLTLALPTGVLRASISFWYLSWIHLMRWLTWALVSVTMVPTLTKLLLKVSMCWASSPLASSSLRVDPLIWLNNLPACVRSSLTISVSCLLIVAFVKSRSIASCDHTFALL